MLQNAIYKHGRLVALDGYIIPIRIGAYLLDSPRINGIHHHALCMGIDSLSGTLSFAGGNVEFGEKLWPAAVSEAREETGRHRNFWPAHPRIITYFSNTVANRRARTYDAPVKYPTVGCSYKLRVVMRVFSEVPPEEQSPRGDEKFPELIRPSYRTVLPIDLDFMQLRPCFAHAIRQADELGMLYRNIGEGPIKLDYAGLALRWAAMRIHPAIIRYYCGEQPNLPPWQYELRNATFVRMLENLEKAEAERHALFTKEENIHPDVVPLLEK